MNIVIVAPKTGRLSGNITDIEKKCTEQGDKCFHIFREKGDTQNIMAQIKSYEPDILITEDMEGFEMCTLTDAVSYNLVHCRQYHFLLSDHIANERYLAKQLSLVMTFVTADAGKADALRAAYPDLPEVVTMEELPESIGSLVNFS